MAKIKKAASTGTALLCFYLLAMAFAINRFIVSTKILHYKVSQKVENRQDMVKTGHLLPFIGSRGLSRMFFEVFYKISRFVEVQRIGDLFNA